MCVHIANISYIVGSIYHQIPASFTPTTIPVGLVPGQPVLRWVLL